MGEPMQDIERELPIVDARLTHSESVALLINLCGNHGRLAERATHILQKPT